MNITFVCMCVCMYELCNGSAGAVLKVIVFIRRQAMKVTNWERQMGSMSAGIVYDKDGQLWCDFQSLAVATLYVRADFKNGPKKAMVSERVCLRKLFDCLAARSDQEQMEAIINIMSRVAVKHTYVETCERLAVWFGKWAEHYPSTAISFLASVTDADLQASMHIRSILETLARSKIDPVRSAAESVRDRAEQDSAAVSTPQFDEDSNRQPEQEEDPGRAAIDELVARQNEAARESKKALRRRVCQSALLETERPPPRAGDEGTNVAIKDSSRSEVQRRLEKRKKQQKRRQRLAERKAGEADEEFSKVLKEVERLKNQTDTSSQPNSNGAADASGTVSGKVCAEKGDRVFETRHRGDSDAKALASRIVGGAQRGEKMRREIAKFICNLPPTVVAPDAETFPDNLVRVLLAGPQRDYEAADTTQVYGAFASAFLKRNWSDPMLRRVRANAVWAAAAASS